MLETNLTNLISWMWQVFVIATLGWLLPSLFRIRHPRTQLAYYHAVLALCLILPLAEPWRHPVIHSAELDAAEGSTAMTSTGPVPSAAQREAAQHLKSPAPANQAGPANRPVASSSPLPWPAIRQLPWTRIIF